MIKVLPDPPPSLTPTEEPMAAADSAAAPPASPSSSSSSSAPPKDNKNFLARKANRLVVSAEEKAERLRDRKEHAKQTRNRGRDVSKFLRRYVIPLQFQSPDGPPEEFDAPRKERRKVILFDLLRERGTEAKAETAAAAAGANAEGQRPKLRAKKAAPEEVDVTEIFVAAEFKYEAVSKLVAAGNMSWDALGPEEQLKMDELVRCLSVAAHFGHADAQFALATVYAHGRGVKKSPARAAHWYREAANQGDAEAQYNLGLLHLRGRRRHDDDRDNGHGIHGGHCHKNNGDGGHDTGGGHGGNLWDYSKAARWLLKAAEQGHAKAQACLGRLHDKGLGVNKDRAEAVRWYRLAADRDAGGDAALQLKLGGMYQHGVHVEADAPEATRWYRKAAASDSAEAKALIGGLFDKKVETSGEDGGGGSGGGGGGSGQSSGVALSPAEALRWYREAGAQGHLRAQLRAAALCDAGDAGDAVSEGASSAPRPGRGVQRDLTEAAHW